MTRVREAVMGIWFAVVGLSFWGPYGGIFLEKGTLMYGICLMASLTILALRLARRHAGVPVRAVPRTGNKEGARRG